MKKSAISPSSILHIRNSQFAIRNSFVIFLLWAFFAQAVTSMVVKSPTVDEQAHLMRGYVYLELGDLRFKLGHPILASALNAFPLWALTDLSIPTEDAAWLDNRWGPFADHFIWRPGNNVDLIFFLSRLVTVALGMLFAALVFRWARQLWGVRSAQSPSHPSWGGVIALALFVFDPTIVAHSQLTTDDVAVSFFYFAATYGLWRYLETDRARDLVLTGIAFGLAQGCKFSALLLIPVFVAVVALWPFLHTPSTGSSGRCAASRCFPFRCSRWLLSHAVGLLIIFALGGLTLWAAYRFEFRPLPGWRLPVPAAAYFEDLIWESKYFGREGYVFLCGDYSATGWWYYLLVAFALKSPLPAMLLLGATLVSLRHRACPERSRRSRRASRPRLTALLLPACAYFLSTFVVSLNIGYRFFIPVLPYLYVLAGGLVAQGHHRRNPVFRKKPGFWLPSGLVRAIQRERTSHCSSFIVHCSLAMLVWSAMIALCIHPHYLAYFNALAGGPGNGWRYLVDSNIDWGQDLPALHDVVERHNLGRIKLSYFGTAHPSYYGLDFEPLPTWEPTPEQGNPFTRTYYPYDPSPGIYAISATHLQGVVMHPDEWDTYAWFRDEPPFAKAGYSIFLYRVDPTGPPVDVALSGLQVDELAPETFAAFGSNDIRLRWFDARTSLVIPSQPGWYAVLDVDDFLRNRVFRKKPGFYTHPCTTTAGSVVVASAAKQSPSAQACRLYPPDPSAHAAAMTYIEYLSSVSRAWHSPALAPSPPELGGTEGGAEGGDEQISPLALPINLSNQLEFLGYKPHPVLSVVGGTDPSHSPFRNSQLAIRNSQFANLLTAWRVTAPPDGPRAIFVHLLTPDGQIAAQWDGLDVPVEGWREGDTILQAASFELPADLPPGQYWLQTGVYNPATMERLSVLVDGTSIADRILLSPVRVLPPKVGGD